MEGYFKEVNRRQQFNELYIDCMSQINCDGSEAEVYSLVKNVVNKFIEYAEREKQNSMLAFVKYILKSIKHTENTGTICLLQFVADTKIAMLSVHIPCETDNTWLLIEVVYLTIFHACKYQ